MRSVRFSSMDSVGMTRDHDGSILSVVVLSGLVMKWKSDMRWRGRWMRQASVNGSQNSHFAQSGNIQMPVFWNSVQTRK